MTQPQNPAITPELIREHGLTPEEYAKIEQLLGGRAPTLTELGIFSVMWSEHCSYKSSRVHLKRLPTRSKLVVRGRGKTRASSTWATGGHAPSRSSRTITRRLLNPFRGDHRSGRDPARHFHDGRAAGGGDGFASVWAD